MSLNYRPDIDGLRAIAVCSVLVYHAKFNVAGHTVLEGGFLGVDIFFVISGFLISSLILEEWDRTGRFSILNFYERRARRLLPALFAVIFASLPAAWFILLPTQMEEFVRSLLTSVFFVSNMFWYSISLEYGAESGLIKPFLHTWSLAVEEQFYIFFPLLFIALLRFAPRLVLPFLALGTLGGLIVAEYWTRRDAELSFYWVISRLWELLAGAFLAHLSMRRPQVGQRLAAWRVLPGAGLLLLGVPLFLPDLIEHHPGFITVPTVIGTCLIIAFAHPREPVTRMLSSRPFVAVGLISYSLYLWHYPIFAFGRLLDPIPEVSDRVIWLILSFALALLSWRIVEHPFRDQGMIPLRRLITTGLTSAAAVGAFGAAMMTLEGYPARLAALYAIYAPAEPDNARIKDIHGGTWDALKYRAEDLGISGSPHVRQPTPFDSAFLWFDMDRQQDEKILIIGNSLSIDLYSAFAQNAYLFQNRQFARTAMRADFTERHTNILMASPNFRAADTILIAHAYTTRSAEGLRRFLDRVLPTGKKVILAENSPIFRKTDGYFPFDWYVRTHKGMKSQEELNRLSYEKLETSHRISKINAAMAAVAAEYGVPVLSRKDLICDDLTLTCKMVTDDGYKMFTDQHHYTRKGAAWIGLKIWETDWLEQATFNREDHVENGP